MMKSSLLHCYHNGNYSVRIYSDGSKIRFTQEEEFLPKFPESIDLKITNYCDLGCQMCHEKSSISGKHANLDTPFLTTLKNGTELAIGGGNPLSHPDLKAFLMRMKKQGIICNLTVNAKHFVDNQEMLVDLLQNKLIYGLGISVVNDEFLREVIVFAKKFPNTVLHLIAGIIDDDLLNKLKNHGLKILILGYKRLGRGIDYYSNFVNDKINILKTNILSLQNHFQVIAFDNLAIEQLELKKQLDNEIFETLYMGDDGMFTMYIDLVEGKFAKSSTSLIRYDLEDKIVEMFNKIRQENK